MSASVGETPSNRFLFSFSNRLGSFGGKVAIGGEQMEQPQEEGDSDSGGSEGNEPVFGLGDGTPGLEVAKGAISLSQRTKHRAWIQQLDKIQSAEGVVQLLEAMRVRVPWKFSTTETKIGEILGAVRRVDAYGGCRRLREWVKSTVFQDYKRGVHLEVLKEEVRSPQPLQVVHVERVLEELLQAENWEVYAALALQWGTAARPNCVLKLQIRNVEVTEGGLRVKFVEGKGVAARGEPYTVHSTLGEWWGPVSRWLCIRKGHRFLFEDTRRERIKAVVRTTLRKCDVRYGLRSIRRGAAIALARVGVPMSVLLHFTGHRTKEMCLRYLDWGWEWGEMRTEGTAAGRHLWLEDTSSDEDSGSNARGGF